MSGSQGPRITLRTQPALQPVVRVPRGMAYQACSLRIGPSLPHPCELGATAWDPLLGNLTDKVSRQLCPS